MWRLCWSPIIRDGWGRGNNQRCREDFIAKVAFERESMFSTVDGAGKFRRLEEEAVPTGDATAVASRTGQKPQVRAVCTSAVRRRVSQVKGTS